MPGGRHGQRNFCVGDQGSERLPWGGGFGGRARPARSLPRRGGISEPGVAQRTPGARTARDKFLPPRGCIAFRLCNPFGVENVLLPSIFPGCAARPRALVFNRFAVK